MKPYQQYMCHLLSNPEWMKGIIHRYSSDGKSVSGSQLATAVADLDNFLARQFDMDEDAGDSA